MLFFFLSPFLLPLTLPSAASYSSQCSQLLVFVPFFSQSFFFAFISFDFFALGRFVVVAFLALLTNCARYPVKLHVLRVFECWVMKKLCTVFDLNEKKLKETFNLCENQNFLTF